MIDRRSLVSASAAGAAAVLAAGKVSAKTPRRPFVLVHGAWHGGWCWEKVRVRLQRRGARVFTPTLSGLGERVHLADPPPSLDTHIRDIGNVLIYEDLRDVVLVAHSYGGMVASGVADRSPERVAALVYLDAAVPSDGQSMVTQKPGVTPEEVAATTESLRSLAPDGAYMAPPPLEVFAVGALPAEEAASVAARLTPHPLRSWLDPIRLTGAGAHIPRTYVHCTSPPLEPSSFPAWARILRNDPAWRYEEIATGHDAMLTAPEAVARILLSV